MEIAYSASCVFICSRRINFKQKATWKHEDHREREREREWYRVARNFDRRHCLRRLFAVLPVKSLSLLRITLPYVKSELVSPNSACRYGWIYNLCLKLSRALEPLKTKTNDFKVHLYPKLLR